MKKIFVLLFLCVFSFTGMAFASIEEVIVETRGTGENREDAIKLALAEAVGQVKGVELSSQSQSKAEINIANTKSEGANFTKNNLNITAGEKLEEEVKTATSGIIKSYKVLSEKPSRLIPGHIDVVLSVTIVKGEENLASKRSRIVVTPFRIEKKNDNYATFVDLLRLETINQLTQSRNFTILDRDFLAEKQKEFDYLASEDIKVTERARIGNTLGTDYIIVGSLLYMDTSYEHKPIPYTDKKEEYCHIQVEVTWRLIQSTTGQIMLSERDSLRHTIKSGEEGSDLSMADIAIVMGKDIADSVQNSIYPLMPVAYADGVLTIPQGAESVLIGQKFDLIKQGAVIYNDYTKEVVGKEEKIVGIVEIIRATPQISYAKILKTSLSQEELKSLKKRQYILRPRVVQYEAKPKKKAPAPAKTQTPSW